MTVQLTPDILALGPAFIDISHWQGGDIDFSAVKDAGVSAVCLKATEGLTFVDSTYADRIAAAESAGLRVAAYHFAQPSESGADEQADHFLDTIDRTDIPVVLDYEVETLHPEDAGLWIQSFLAAVRDSIAQTALYASVDTMIHDVQWPEDTAWPDWWAGYWPAGDAADVLAVDGNPDRYIAPLGGSPGVNVPPKVHAWQWTNSAHIPGIEGSVDLSLVVPSA